MPHIMHCNVLSYPLHPKVRYVPLASLRAFCNFRKNIYSKTASFNTHIFIVALHSSKNRGKSAFGKSYMSDVAKPSTKITIGGTTMSRLALASMYK